MQEKKIKKPLQRQIFRVEQWNNGTGRNRPEQAGTKNDS